MKPASLAGAQQIQRALFAEGLALAAMQRHHLSIHVPSFVDKMQGLYYGNVKPMAHYV